MLPRLAWLASLLSIASISAARAYDDDQGFQIGRASLYEHPHVNDNSEFYGQASGKLRRRDCQPLLPTTPKWVFAHFVVSNAANYTVQDWQNDMTLAFNTGIDGFALRIGTNPSTIGQVNMAYVAANATGLNFKLYVVFDMEQFVTADEMLPYITTYGLHPNQFIYGAKVFASTIGGENITTLGEATPAQGWQTDFKLASAKSGYPIYFVPAFPTLDIASFFTAEPAADGVSNLDAWPVGPAASMDLSNATDIEYLASATEAGKTYMLPISPSFFSHSIYQNRVYRTDDWEYSSRWEQAIALGPDFVQILTWNDYERSDYIGPISTTRPEPAFVPGYPHTAFLLLSQFYIARYKQGGFPVITTDALVFWYRTSSKNAVAPLDTIGRPKGYQNVDDMIYVEVICVSPGELTISSGDATSTTPVIAGINKLKMAFREGKVQVVLTRNGGVVLNSSGTGPLINNTIAAYNFNPYAEQVIAGTVAVAATSAVGSATSSMTAATPASSGV
ncbi:glycoside hydrolase family 71 protein [Mixia osmundae IAM 14324]|uniref:Glycoside hydrolase family 71 protein n=1 Tax=Mixia osmundae (strain CBS 9802 / IAM 14324 / JCM 22182 / KY 12970) TaxID=764103 RepID=G7EAM4_MIXOS|nr:glycoside hydrolase family 71 protein [Mixia osmundae IAM 14324]KEI38203.1 glycoside hydrolase family 71 protein [Mixia osmundae IAM 14324]GAA99884.1 hypothetical protein E5Q_06587 [Mixia osmundae IAM 14324]